ncbi:NUDIX domain-containing protein [Neobacillus bataviensis]|uniref:NUDIX domain-containing protein n=1 Tax=Neobacillus bataviensis TaxID=220685 RepID=UPI001CBEEA57|nr:NUDIX domain-containing protein [Neobacillus bataviensis]
MDYCKMMRSMIGNTPLIIVRPSVAIMNHQGEILLSRFSGGSWGIPGGILQLDESVEDCIKRNVQEEIGLKLNRLSLFGVFSGGALMDKPEDGSDEYQMVAIGYICTDYKGEVRPDENQAIEAEFFPLDQLPEEMDPFIKEKLAELKGSMKKLI